jgi:hypothetical protein
MADSAVGLHVTAAERGGANVLGCGADEIGKIIDRQDVADC